MKKTICCICALLSIVIISASQGSTQFKYETIDAVKLTDGDIPEGYMYGKIPAPYQSTLKNNPWLMDKAAIKRLADKVYPGGDHNKITGMHVSILTEKNRPYGDDIVCYVILYAGIKAARDEIKKLAEFTGYNNDRAILISKDNLAVVLFVDDINNFHFIQEMAKAIEERLKKI
jgi:hypothetical protein